MKDIELSTSARSYQKVASEKERSGDNTLAAILYLKSAKYYVDAVKLARKESDRTTWKRLGEYCLSKSDALKFAGKRGVTGEAGKSISSINAEEGLKNYVENFIVSTEQIEADLDDVAGLRDAKSIINDLKIAIEHPEVLERHPRLRPPQGILLYGPPGCGKTYFAGAIAKELDTTFFYVSAAELLSKYYGESLKMIRTLFEVARERSPSIIFIDEIDALAMDRGRINNETNKQVVTQFLNEMDGFKSKIAKEAVFLISATNVFPEMLDKGFTRSGRIDASIFVDLPDEIERAKIFKSSLKGEDISEDINFNELALMTEGYSGADISLICNVALREIVREEIEKNSTIKITMDILKSAIGSVKRSVSVGDRDKYIEQMNELGVPRG